MVILCCNSKMETLAEIRRKNLLALVEENGLTSVAARVGRSAAQISDTIAGRKSFGEKVARAIEQKWDPSRELGWLDTIHDVEHIRSISSTANTTDITIKQYDPEDVAGSMGHGLELRDQPGVIQSLRVSKDWLNQNVKNHSGSANLCIVTGFGDSMQPMFNPGDPLLVDLGVTCVEFDAVFFFRVGTEGYIKRLQRIPTEDGLVIRAISENKSAYEAFNITPKMDFQVLGRVLKVWRSQEF